MVTADDLARATALPVSAIATTLTDLELQRLVVQEEDGTYRAVAT
jgi:DNA-binding IclR family transcriptional regulator